MTEVRNGRFGRGVYAVTDIRRGEKIFSGWGPTMSHRTRHSLQVSVDTHVVIKNEIELINHSCDPNCGVLIRFEEQRFEIYALRDIPSGEELCTDYASFEYEIEFMTGPCQCGSPICRGQVTGYRGLPSERRAALEPYIAEYLRELDDAVPAPELSGIACSDRP